MKYTSNDIQIILHNHYSELVSHLYMKNFKVAHFKQTNKLTKQSYKVKFTVIHLLSMLYNTKDVLHAHSAKVATDLTFVQRELKIHKIVSFLCVTLAILSG